MSSKSVITFRGSFAPLMSAIKIGPDVTRLTIDVPKSEQLNAVGLQALLETPLVFTVKADTSPASTRIERPDDKPKPDKPVLKYTRYWQLMHIKGVTNHHDLQELLQCGAKDVHDELRKVFKVEHLSDSIGPREFEQLVTQNFLSEGLVTLSRNAEAEAAEQRD